MSITSAPVGVAISLALALLFGLTQAQAGCLDDPLPSASAAAVKMTGAEPAATAGSSSPPIGSIRPSTELAVFLLPDVPVELTRAVLRRAWTNDPAIRDFVGLFGDAVVSGR